MDCRDDERRAEAVPGPHPTFSAPNPPAQPLRKHGPSPRHRWEYGGRDASEGKGPQRRPQRRLGRRLEEVAKAVGGGYCRLQMPLRVALGIRGTVAGHRLGALEVGGGGTPPPSNSILDGGSETRPTWRGLWVGFGNMGPGSQRHQDQTKSLHSHKGRTALWAPLPCSHM